MTTPNALTAVAVIGNGIIGHGIAQIFASAGYPVRLIGRNPASLARALDNIKSSLARFEAHGLVTADEAAETLNRVATSTDLGDAAAAQLVFEAVTEDIPLKHGIFLQLDEICPPPTILASSSGQPASKLVAQVTHRERVVAAHFWYPPQLIPLVEVCAGPETAPDVVPWLCDVLKRVGKEPVVIDREIAGFIGNRLQFALLREAWALWASGAASAEAIDAVVRNSFGRRLAITGPIESADVGGLDTFDAFASFLFPELDVNGDPPAAIHELTKQGARGLPNGRGVYDWSKRNGSALLAARTEELFRHLQNDQARRAAEEKQGKPSAEPLNELLNEEGQVTRWSKKQNEKRLVLEYLQGKFEPNTTYTEREVNARLNDWHTFGDAALLRRELCDNELLERTTDGKAYWLPRDAQPT